MFRKYGVFTEAELRSRYEVYYEDFKTRSRIEGELALIMARTVINPAVVRHLKQIGAAAGAATVPALDAELEVAGSLYGELTKAEAALEEVLPTGDPELIRARQAEPAQAGGPAGKGGGRRIVAAAEVPRTPFHLLKNNREQPRGVSE